MPKRFRNGIERFKNQNISILEIDPLTNDHNISHQNNHLREVSRGNGSKYLTYRPMIEYIFDDKVDSERYMVRAYMSKEHIEGYYILEKLSDNSIGFYCGLTSISAGGITEYLDSLIFIELAVLGYKYIYLGGSEHIGVVNYVNKLLPTDPPYSNSPLIYYK